MDKGRYREELRALEESCKPIDAAIARQSATSEEVQRAIELQNKYVQSCRKSIEQIDLGEVDYQESSMEEGKWTSKCINDDIVDREKREIFLHNLAARQ